MMIGIPWWAAILYGALGGLICQAIFWGINKKQRNLAQEREDAFICEIEALQKENMEIKAKLHSAEKIAEEEVEEKFQRMKMSYSVALCKAESKNAKILYTVFKAVEMLQKILEEK